MYEGEVFYFYRNKIGGIEKKRANNGRTASFVLTGCPHLGESRLLSAIGRESTRHNTRFFMNYG